MIKNLWRLHLGLTKYIIRELPKKKTRKEVIGFLKPLLGVYLQELLKMYKSLFLVFDKNYREQKKQYDKMQKIKVDLQRCLKMLQYVDQKMAKTGISRQRRRQFWRDFYKDGQLRKEVFDELLKEINQIR
jgi:hypothetical protein